MSNNKVIISCCRFPKDDTHKSVLKYQNENSLVCHIDVLFLNVCDVFKTKSINLVGGRFYKWYGGRNLLFWSGLLCFVWSFLIVCFVFGEWVAKKKRSTIGKWDKMVEGEGELEFW